MSSPKRYLQLKEAEKKLLHELYKSSPVFERVSGQNACC